MKNKIKSNIKEKLQYHFNRILIDTGTERAIANRLSQLNNVWFQLAIPSIDILESVCRPIKIKMGNVFEIIAEAIADDIFDEVKRDHDIEGKVSEDTILEIDNIIGEYQATDAFPNYENDKKKILAAQKIVGRSIHPKMESVDLYLRANKDIICFELKSGGKHDTTAAPALKRRLLTRLAILNSLAADCKLGLTYNPYGEDDEYAWPQMTSLFELHKELLVGKEFWNFIGKSDKTYDDLKKIFAEVGPPMEYKAIDVVNKILRKSPNNRNNVKLTYKEYKGVFEP